MILLFNKTNKNFVISVDFQLQHTYILARKQLISTHVARTRYLRIAVLVFLYRNILKTVNCTVYSFAKENLLKTYARHCNLFVYNNLNFLFLIYLFRLLLDHIFVFLTNQQHMFRKINCTSLSLFFTDTYDKLHSS